MRRERGVRGQTEEQELGPGLGPGLGQEGVRPRGRSALAVDISSQAGGGAGSSLSSSLRSSTVHGNGHGIPPPQRERSGGSFALSLEGSGGGGGGGTFRLRGDSKDGGDDTAGIHDHQDLFSSPKSAKSSKSRGSSSPSSSRDNLAGGGAGGGAGGEMGVGSCSPGTLKRQASQQLDMLPTPFALSFGASLENEVIEGKGSDQGPSPATGRSLFSGLTPPPSSVAGGSLFGKQPTVASFGTLDYSLLSTPHYTPHPLEQ